jgi:hypothetical protein
MAAVGIAATDAVIAGRIGQPASGTESVAAE